MFNLSSLHFLERILFIVVMCWNRVLWEVWSLILKYSIMTISKELVIYNKVGIIKQRRAGLVRWVIRSFTHRTVLCCWNDDRIRCPVNKKACIVGTWKWKCWVHRTHSRSKSASHLIPMHCVTLKHPLCCIALLQATPVHCAFHLLSNYYVIIKILILFSINLNVNFIVNNFIMYALPFIYTVIPNSNEDKPGRWTFRLEG